MKPPSHPHAQQLFVGAVPGGLATYSGLPRTYATLRAVPSVGAGC